MARVLMLRRPEAGGYGFNLTNIDGNNILRVVDADGVAARAGAQVGDIILKVNDMDMAGKSHGDLVAAIKASGQAVQLTVRQLGAPTAKPATSTSAQIVGVQIVRESGGFGFNLSTGHGGTHLFRVVDVGGPAERAGVHVNDHIVEINGVATTGLSHAQVVELIKRSGNSVDMRIGLAIASDLGAPSGGQAVAAVDSLQQARQRAEEALRQQRQDEQRKQDEETQLRREAIYEKEMAHLEQAMTETKQAILDLREQLLRQKSETERVATRAEREEVEKLLNMVEQQMLAELNDKQDTLPLAKDNETQFERWDRLLAEKGWEHEVAIMQQQLAAARLKEFRALKEVAASRRAAEKQRDDQEHARIKQARERDLQLLKNKQLRMDQLMEDAQTKKAEQEAVQQAARQRDLDERRRQTEERQQRTEQMKDKWAAEVSTRKHQDEERKRRDEQDRIFQERDAERRHQLEKARQLAQQREEEEAEEQARLADKGRAFGAPLRATAGAKCAVGEGLQHPMV